MTTMTTDTFLTPKQVAERLGISVGTLAQWRYLGLNLQYHKFGHSVRYDQCDVNRYIKHSARQGTGEAR